MKTNEENRKELQRLLSLLDRVDEDQLNRQLANGWTVATALAHIAFWDRYVVAILAEWGRKGFSQPATQYDALNEAIESMSLAIPRAALLDWVRQSAAAANGAADAVPPELAEAIEAGGRGRFLDRYAHRRHHLDQIETLLRN